MRQARLFSKDQFECKLDLPHRAGQRRDPACNRIVGSTASTLVGPGFWDVDFSAMKLQSKAQRNSRDAQLCSQWHFADPFSGTESAVEQHLAKSQRRPGCL